MKRREMGLGNYRTVSLADARRLAAEARQLVKKGVDPIHDREARLAAVTAATAGASSRKFETVAEAMIQNREVEWKNEKHRQQWRNTLKTYAYPVLGGMQVGDINVHHIKAVLVPIWLTKHETATRVRSRIENVLDYAISCGFRQVANPASSKALKSHLPQSSKILQRKHFAAMPYAEVPDFISKLMQNRNSISSRALVFTILTGKRSSEVRGICEDELDIENRIWDIPAARMKAGKPHREPLANQTIKLLESIPRIQSSALIFPGMRGQMSDMTLTSCLRKIHPGVTVHGFRSTFRQWAAEQTGHPREVCELALSHAVGSKVEQAYQRSDLLGRRALLMQEWADFCFSAMPADNA